LRGTREYKQNVCGDVKQVTLCENWQRQSCNTSLSYLSVQKWLVGDVPFYVKIWQIRTNPLAKRRFSSAVTPSQKSSINTNRKSTLRFPVSLRWTSYVVPKPQRGAVNRKMAIFHVKSHYAEESLDTRFLCMNTISEILVRCTLTRVRCLAVAKTPCDCSYSILTRSASAVTASEKRSINTIRKSTTRFPMSLIWIVYVAKPPKGGAITRCPEFKEQYAITSKRYKIGCQLLLITNRKSYTVFQLVPTSVTLNDLEWRNSTYFALLHWIR